MPAQLLPDTRRWARELGIKKWMPHTLTRVGQNNHDGCRSWGLSLGASATQGIWPKSLIAERRGLVIQTQPKKRQ